MVHPKQSQRSAEESPQEIADVIIIGGGIHGASVAHLAAATGLRVNLFEANDFAAATSSRSSKMAHGGLRYLELFDFPQVFEGIRAREELFQIAPHLVIPERFLIPVPRRDYWFRAKLATGLWLYDLFVKEPAHRHKWRQPIDAHAIGAPKSSTPPMGYFDYCDGLMNDALWVLETLRAATDHGARVYNYAPVTKIERCGDGIKKVHWTDLRSGAPQLAFCRLVINCAGPWAPTVSCLGGGAPTGEVKYSRGTHLVFSVPWRGPSLFLPLAGKARYYFVWPHPTGTMVGTTEREVDSAELDPMPFPDEIEEILARLQKDLPQSGLNRSTLHYCFAGVRTLPLRSRGNTSQVTQLSRKHLWQEDSGILSLYGGKLTTARWTAREGVRLALRSLGEKRPLAVLDKVPLRRSPSGGTPGDTPWIEPLRRRLLDCGMDRDTVTRLLKRYGPDAAYILSEPSYQEKLLPNLIRGEIDLVVQFEWARTVEDIMRRRFLLEYRPDHGRDLLPVVVAALERVRHPGEVAREARDYLARMESVDSLIQQRPACVKRPDPLHQAGIDTGAIS